MVGVGQLRDARRPETQAPPGKPGQSSGRGFRADIQALRAIAVVAVVLYHLWPQQIRGGFVGVDVFFVISGFLITRQLADEHERTGRISLTQFWARRIRRLLPAAYFVLGASLAVLLLALPTVAWRTNLQEIAAAGGYVENWLLGIHAVDYLAAENSASLVQHYWSLSAEEQFYLAWPLLVLASLVAGRRAAGGRRLLVLVLAVAAASSFAFSVRYTAANPAMAFFATPARAWEFAAGGLVALTTRPPAVSRVRAAASWCGLAVIAYAVFAISARDPFPGSIALVPVAGAAVVLACGMPAAPGWSPLRLAASRPVRGLGDVSYALYLWHWPLIIAAPWVLHHSLTGTDRALILVLSLGLAAATKRLVEDPVRLRRWWRVRRWPAYGFAAVALAALLITTSLATGRLHRLEASAAVQAEGAGAAAAPVASASARSVPLPAAEQGQHASATSVRRYPVSCFGAGAIVNERVCPRPFARPASLDTAFAAQDGRTYQCLGAATQSVPQFCTFGQVHHPRRVLAVVGNSHARRLIPALDAYGRHHGWEIVLAARINCMGLIDVAVSPTAPDHACQAWSAAVQRHLLALRGLAAVIFASHRDAGLYLDGANPTPQQRAAANRRILATWSAFAAHGIRVIVTGDVPGMRPQSDPECVAMSSATYDPCALPRSAVVHGNLMTALAREHPHVASYLSLTHYFCDAERCHGLIGGVVVYFDSHHMTATFSRSLGPYLGADLQALLAAR